MRRLQTYFSFLLFVLPVFLFSQQTARITGTIQNTKADKVEVEYPSHFLSQMPEVQSGKLDSRGRFSVDIPLSGAAKLGLYCGEVEAQIYVEPGDELSLNIDVKEGPESLTFSGDRAAENTCLQSYLQTFFGDEDQEQGFFLHLQHDLPEDFLVYGEEYLTARESFFNTFNEENPLSESFLTYSADDYTYSYVELMFQYRDRYMDRSREENLPALSSSYYQFLEGVSFQNDAAVNREMYRNAVNAFLQYKFNSLLSERIENFDYDLREGGMDRLTLSKILFQGKTQDMVVAGILAEAISQGGIEEMEEELTAFIEQKESLYPGPVAQLKELKKNPAPARPRPGDWDPEN
ncbi:MAG: hypothetical protein AAF587_31210 [Bacteroidota bacterium]